MLKAKSLDEDAFTQVYKNEEGPRALFGVRNAEEEERWRMLIFYFFSFVEHLSLVECIDRGFFLRKSGKKYNPNSASTVRIKYILPIMDDLLMSESPEKKEDSVGRPKIRLKSSKEPIFEIIDEYAFTQHSSTAYKKYFLSKIKEYKKEKDFYNTVWEAFISQIKKGGENFTGMLGALFFDTYFFMEINAARKNYYSYKRYPDFFSESLDTTKNILKEAIHRYLNPYDDFLKSYITRDEFIFLKDKTEGERVKLILDYVQKSRRHIIKEVFGEEWEAIINVIYIEVEGETKKIRKETHALEKSRKKSLKLRKELEQLIRNP